jgi:hypothetical protein
LAADAYVHLPVFDDFTRLTDPALYTPLPDEWVLGISDIVHSTAAIAAGRYKVVNTAAAVVIAAVANALGGHDFPFVFGPALISRSGHLACMRAPVWQPASGSGHARLHRTSSSERAYGSATGRRL